MTDRTIPKANLRTRLRRHPFGFQAHFDWSLALVYSYPAEQLEPLLPPGLILDTYEEHGFIALALVKTNAMRPKGWPRWSGRNFFLAGLRVFVRYTNPEGRTLRGLKILGSATDSRAMVWGGSLLSHYAYDYVRVSLEESNSLLSLGVSAPFELQMKVDLEKEAELPESSLFPDLKKARLYAGPMPYTFDYEKETHSIVSVRGDRQSWTPRPVEVDVSQMNILPLEGLALKGPQQLANAFLVRDVDYSWRAGTVEPLPHE